MDCWQNFQYPRSPVSSPRYVIKHINSVRKIDVGNQTWNTVNPFHLFTSRIGWLFTWILLKSPTENTKPLAKGFVWSRSCYHARVTAHVITRGLQLLQQPNHKQAGLYILQAGWPFIGICLTSYFFYFFRLNLSDSCLSVTHLCISTDKLTQSNQLTSPSSCASGLASVSWFVIVWTHFPQSWHPPLDS